MCWIIFVNIVTLWGGNKRLLVELCRNICGSAEIHHLPLCCGAKAACVCVCVIVCVSALACLHANTAYIACLNAHVAWNNQVKTAEAWGRAACCCALPSTICLCQKYLLCAEWGMKSIQVPPPYFPSCSFSKAEKMCTDTCQIGPHCQM